MQASLASLPQASASQASAAYAQSKAGAGGRAAPPSSNGTLQKLWQNAQDFETVFLENMFEHLTSGLSGEGPLGGGGAGGEIYRGMLTQQYAKSTVAAGGIGLAPNVYRELVRLQEARTRDDGHAKS